MVRAHLHPGQHERAGGSGDGELHSHVNHYAS
jgi:hypothetical protein